MPTTATKPAFAPGRLAATIGGGLILVLALLAGLAGAGLQWTTGKQDADGFYTTGTQQLVATSSAIATDDLDVNGVPGSFGRVRLTARPGADGKPVFAGIARTRDVDAYLRGAAYATLTDFDLDPFRPTYRSHPGTALPARPADQRFWAATTDGTKALDWKVRDGDWSVVVMNADGSAGVDAQVSAGARLPILDDLELAAWIATGLLFALGGGLLAVGLRRAR